MKPWERDWGTAAAPDAKPWERNWDEPLPEDAPPAPTKESVRGLQDKLLAQNPSPADTAPPVDITDKAAPLNVDLEKFNAPLPGGAPVNAAKKVFDLATRGPLAAVDKVDPAEAARLGRDFAAGGAMTAASFAGAPEAARQVVSKIPDAVSSATRAVFPFDFSMLSRVAASRPAEKIGQVSQDAAIKLEDLAQKVAPGDATFKDKLAMGAGSMAAFWLPGLGAEAAMARVPAFAGMSVKMAQRIGSSVASVLEAGSEAGGVFNTLTQRGVPRETASKEALKDFMGNVILLGLTNNIGVGPEKGKAIARVLKEGSLEALQEGFQEIMSGAATDRAINWRNVAESAGIGGILGAGVRPLIGETSEHLAGNHQLTPEAQEYLQKFPSLADVAQKTLPVDIEKFNANLAKAAASGEEVLLKTGDHEKADQAALMAMAKAEDVKSQPVKAAPEPKTPEADFTPQRIAQELNVGAHELTATQYAQLFGHGRPLEDVANEHRALVLQAMDRGEVVPENVIREQEALQAKPEPPTQEEHLAQQIKAGGGKFIGIQVRDDQEGAALFNDPVTHSTMGLPVSQVSRESVQETIGRNRAKFQPLAEPLKPLPRPETPAAGDATETVGAPPAVTPASSKQEVTGQMLLAGTPNPELPTTGLASAKPQVEVDALLDELQGGKPMQLDLLAGNPGKTEQTKTPKITQRQINEMAQALYQDDLAHHKDSAAGLEQFIIDNGGIRPFQRDINGKKEETEEYGDVPIHLRGSPKSGKSLDVMHQMAVDAGLLSPGSPYSALYNVSLRAKRRGRKPKLSDYYDLARHKIENESAQAKSEAFTYDQAAAAQEAKDFFGEGKQGELELDKKPGVSGASRKAPMEVKYQEEGVVMFPGFRVTKPADVAFAFRQLKNAPVEHFYAVGTQKGKLVSVELISIGDINSVTGAPREAIGLLRQRGADAYYLVHNHPSGDPMPSNQDVRLFQKYNLVFTDLGLRFQGGVVINDTQFGLVTTDFEKKVFDHPAASAEGKATVPVMKKYLEWTGPKPQSPAISGPSDVYELAKGTVLDWDKSGMIFFMNTKSVVLGSEVFPLGTSAEELGAMASESRAASVILATSENKGLGFREDIFNGFGITLTDHIIVTKEGFTSERAVGNVQGREVQPRTEGTEAAPAREEGAPYKPDKNEGVIPVFGTGLVKPVEIKRDYSITKADIDRVLIPSRRDDPKVFTERMALRRSLQRQAFAAAEAANTKAADMTNMKKQLADIVKSRLPVAERGKYLNILAQAKTPNDFVKAIARIDDHVEDVQKKDLLQGIKREMQRVEASKIIAVDYMTKIRGIMQDFLLQKPRMLTIQRMKEAQAAIERAKAAGVNVVMPQYVLDKMRVLTAKPLADLDVTELENLHNNIRLLADLGKTKFKVRKEIERLQKERDMGDLLHGSKPWMRIDPVTAKPGEALPAIEHFMNVFRTTGRYGQHLKASLLPQDVLFDMLDGLQNYTGPNSRIFKANVDQGFSAYLKENMDFRDEAWRRATALKLDEKAMERIGVHAVSRQDSGMEKLANLGLSKDDVKPLTPLEMSFYTWMRDQLDLVRPRIAQVMKDVYNEDLGQVKNYFPFVTNWDLMNEESIDRRMAQQVGNSKSVEKGFTIARVGAGAQKVRVNAMTVLLQHMDDVHYLLNLGATTKYLGELARDPKYAAAVGPWGQLLVQDWIDTIARKGGGGGAKQIRFLDTLRKNVGAATLAYKLSATLVQFTPLVEGAGLLGPTRTAQGAFDIALSKEWRQFVRANFQEIRNRGGDDPAFLDFGGQTKIDRVARGGFWALQKIDLLAASSVAAGAYQKYMGDRGLAVDLAKPNKEAIQYAERIVRRTQSSAFFKDIPAALARGKLTGNKSVDKMILQFQSFVLTKASLLSHDAYEYGVRGNTAQAANILFWSFLASTGLETMARRGVREFIDLLDGHNDREKRSYTEDFVRQLLGNIPFAGNLTGMAYYGSLPVPVLDMAKKTAESVHQYATAKKQKAKGKARGRLALNLSRLLGMPGTAQAEELLK
jgi:hypothetical protein